MRRNPVNRRIRLLLVLLVAAFGVMLLRAGWLQGVRAESLSRLAQVQHREHVVLPARRGTLYDRTGRVLAIGEQATTVYADPRQIKNPRAVALVAAKALGLRPEDVLERISDRTRGFVYVARKADAARAASLARRNILGLGFYPEERRAYPQHTIAAQVLGYAGVDNRGLAGLELALDRHLAGTPGSQTIVRDPGGRVIDVIGERPEREGRDVHLTLDHTIQANAEQVLRRTVSRWGAKSATAVVLEPHTGAILAMAVAPGFDANRFGEAAREQQRNRTVTDTYEPGSTFKVVTVAGVLSEGLVTPQSAYTLRYEIQVADRVIHDAEERGTERLTVSQILSRSSNVGAITLAQQLGSSRLADWITRFGFGRPTGVDYPGESQGIVLPLAKWSGSTIGNVPIGQGIAVTPLQMAALYATFANRGRWVRPHLVDHVAGGGKPSLRPRRVLSREVASAVVKMLQNVVSERGTGYLATVPGYTVAGKTGTAEKPDPSGGYATGKYVASFVGFVPATRPRLVILVTVDEPRGAIFGGVVAAPAFQQIAQFGLQYLEVPPDDRSTIPAASP